MWSDECEGETWSLLFIIVIDDYTRHGHVYLISDKSEALKCFRKFINLVENQLNLTIKALRTDRGSEYLPNKFNYPCDEKINYKIVNNSIRSLTKWSN